VKARDLLYKNPIHIYLKMNVFIGKGGHKVISNMKSISYTFNNQVYRVDY